MLSLWKDIHIVGVLDFYRKIKRFEMPKNVGWVDKFILAPRMSFVVCFIYRPLHISTPERIQHHLDFRSSLRPRVCWSPGCKNVLSEFCTESVHSHRQCKLSNIGGCSSHSIFGKSTNKPKRFLRFLHNEYIIGLLVPYFTAAIQTHRSQFSYSRK